MPQPRRKWTDFPSELVDLVEKFADEGRVAVGPLGKHQAINLRNEIYRFRTAINAAIHAREDMGEELIRLHDIARNFNVYLEAHDDGTATVTVEKTPLATAKWKLGYDKLPTEIEEASLNTVDTKNGAAS